MKHHLLTLLTLLAFALGAQAQSQMHVNLKNGSVLNVFVSEIESVSWDAPSGTPDVNDPDNPTFTGDATDITSYSALLTCYANNILDNLSSDLKIGIIYCTEGTPSKSNGTQKTVSKSQVAGDGKYTISLTGLSEGTTYYYRSFVYQSGLWFYGNVRQFTTTGQNVQVDFSTEAPTSVTCYSAKVSTRMTLTTPQGYGSLSYGICYGTTAETTEKMALSNRDGNGNFSTTLRALTGNTIYYYRPYATIDGTTFYGNISSFKTLEDNVVVTGELASDGTVRSRLTIGSGAYSSLEVGLCWSTSNQLPTVSDKTATTNELDDENYYVIRPSFRAGTNYYRSYVKIDGVAHYGVVKVYEGEPMTAGHAIDLGLSVKWADMNVGASKPEDYGEYFAWGETEPKDVYNWNTYKWCSNGRWTGITKYTYPDGQEEGIWYNNNTFVGDNKTTLDPDDDAAHVNWGGAWRMPTRAEQDELRNKCSWSWTTQNGVNGYKVVGPNGNSLFLPAAGCRRADYLSDVGSWGLYWSSSLVEYYSGYAYSLYFDSGYVYWYDYDRFIGFSVRPVCQ